MTFRDLSGALKIVLTASLAIALYSSFGPHAQILEEYEARVDSVLVVNDSLRTLERSAKREADRLRTLHENIATIAEANEPVIRTRIVTVRDSFPATTTGEIERDSIIDALVVEGAQWRTAYTLAVQESDSLRAALLYSTQANVALTKVLEERPKPRAWWVPRIVVGPSALMAIDGGTAAGLGVTIGWEIRR